jgi:Fic family protein
MSSFEIERIKPSASRSEKFIGLLMMAENRDFCEKSCLIDLQNHIVDPRFRDKAYRSNQNYVGQVISYQKKIVHYICPKPEDLHELMDGLLSAHRIMIEGGVPAVIHTAVIAYGFVFMHPFEDGNGRIHRFLIHNILSLRRAVPKGLMFPISAAMLKNPDLYDRSLESFSKPLMQKIEYDLNDLGQLTVQGETISFYRYMDMTTQAEAMYDFVQLTVEQELTEELNFIESYDRTKRQIQNIVDMPDNLIDLFIQLSLQNNGRISNNKRTSHFRFLTDKELEQMEEAVREGYRKQ